MTRDSSRRDHRTAPHRTDQDAATGRGDAGRCARPAAERAARAGAAGRSSTSPARGVSSTPNALLSTCKRSCWMSVIPTARSRSSAAPAGATIGIQRRHPRAARRPGCARRRLDTRQRRRSAGHVQAWALDVCSGLRDPRCAFDPLNSPASPPRSRPPSGHDAGCQTPSLSPGADRRAEGEPRMVAIGPVRRQAMRRQSWRMVVAVIAVSVVLLAACGAGQSPPGRRGRFSRRGHCAVPSRGRAGSGDPARDHERSEPARRRRDG